MTNTPKPQANTLDKELDIVAANTIFLFNHFIKKAMPDSYAHYIDNDDNLAESTRKSIRAVAKDAKKPIQALISKSEQRGHGNAWGKYELWHNKDTDRRRASIELTGSSN